MLEVLKNNLETNNVDHQIYFELTEEEIEKELNNLFIS